MINNKILMILLSSGALLLGACEPTDTDDTADAGQDLDTPIDTPDETPIDTPDETPIDSDNDGLTDEEENILGTSNSNADTDYDGLTDYEEYQVGGFNPRVSNIPKLVIKVESAATLELFTEESSQTNQTNDLTVNLEQGESSALSGSNSTATSEVLNKSAKIATELKGSYSFPGGSVSAKINAEASISEALSGSYTSNVNKESAENTSEQYRQFEQQNVLNNVSVTGGRISTSVSIANTSDRSIVISDLEILAKIKAPGSSEFQTVATLIIEQSDEDITLAPGGKVEKVVSSSEQSIGLMKQLMANPTGIIFQPSNQVINYEDDSEALTFTKRLENIAAGTSQIIIDYGVASDINGDTVKHYLVSTNVERDADDLSLKGLNIDVILQDVLNIPFTTKTIDIKDADSETDEVKGTKEVIASLNGVVSGSLQEGAWYVFSTSQSMSDQLVNFSDINVKPTESLIIVYIKDSDGDGLTDREEYILGTDINVYDSEDTDRDGLDDIKELAGWDNIITTKTRQLNGDFVTETKTISVTSDVGTKDTDNDGLYDDVEESLKTNPRLSDSDGDGLTDFEEVTGFFTTLLNDENAEHWNIYVRTLNQTNSSIVTYENKTPYFTDPNSNHSDSDELSDYEEVAEKGTDPTKGDSDDDGLEDHVELLEGWEVAVNGEDGVIKYSDALDWNSDGDSLSDSQEFNNKTDPKDADSDGDTWDDADEISNKNTNPLMADTDEDGVNDNIEISIGTDPNVKDGCFKARFTHVSRPQDLSHSAEVTLIMDVNNGVAEEIYKYSNTFNITKNGTEIGDSSDNKFVTLRLGDYLKFYAKIDYLAVDHDEVIVSYFYVFQNEIDKDQMMTTIDNKTTETYIKYSLERVENSSAGTCIVN